MRHPVKDVFITQEWGGNSEIYKRFGLKGHNGIDYRAPDGTPVLAPHDGVVKERRLDEKGYGNYLKIENNIEGSVLAHLKDFNVGVNKNVQEGDLVGWADNTGFSIGSHLHWGYYRIPRNREDGYLGYINQKPFLQGPQQVTHTYTPGDENEDPELLRKKRDANWNLFQTCKSQLADADNAIEGATLQINELRRQRQEFAKILNSPDDPESILHAIGEMITAQDGLRESKKALEQCQEEKKTAEEETRRCEIAKEELERRLGALGEVAVRDSVPETVIEKPKGGESTWGKLLRWIIRLFGKR